MGSRCVEWRDTIHEGADMAISAMVAVVGGIIMVARGQKAQGTPETADAIGYVRSE